ANEASIGLPGALNAAACPTRFSLPLTGEGRQRGYSRLASVRAELVVAGEIAEARQVAFERQLDRADGAMALLADDDLGLSGDGHHLLLPFGELGGSLRRLKALDVIFLAEHEHHDVGVLLDRARLAKVGELRTLVLALLDLARQLRQRDDRHRKLLGEGLEAGGDLGDLLHAVVAALG